MIKPIGPEYAEYIAAHQEMYPEAMREDTESFRAILESTHYCFGFFSNEVLVAWALCSAETPASAAQVYWYDLAVLPSHQKTGCGAALMAHAYRELRWHGQWVRMHTRRATYPRNEEGLRRCGYKIIRDTFLPHHYLGEYGIDEDAHELLLAPV